MTEELKEIGLDVGHRRVGRLMRQNGISVVRTRKYKVTTDSDHKFNIAPNLVDRDFTADAPNQKWAGDISYVWTREGWLYLAVILDLHSRRVIGWAVSNRMKRDLAIRALKMAIAFRQPPEGCIYYPAGDCEAICREGIIRIAAANIVRTIIKRSCAKMDSRYQCLGRAIVTTTPPLRRSSKPPLGTLLRNTLPGSDQSQVDMAAVMGNAQAS
jgi:transposase InsO family protein